MFPVGTPANETVYLHRLYSDPFVYFFWVPFNWIGLFISLFAVASSYAFKKQRKFPSSVAIWTVLLDSMIFFREALIKYSAYGPLQERMVYNVDQDSCLFLFSWNTFGELGQGVCNVTLALVVYLSVVKKVDLSYETEKRFFWGVVIVFWVYAGTLTAAFASTTHYRAVNFSCTAETTLPYLFLAAQWFSIFIFLVIVMGRSLVYIRRVLQATAHQKANSSQRKKIYLHVRFIAIAFVQTAPRLSGNIYYSYIAAVLDYDKKIFLNMVNTTFVFYVFFNIADSIIVIIGNRHFWKWVKQQRKKFGGWRVSKEKSTTSSSNNVVLDAVIELPDGVNEPPQREEFPEKANLVV